MPTKAARKFVLVPFVREKSRHISVEARLRGRPVRFIVDTGAGVTCVDSTALARFKLELSAASRKGGGVGSSTMKMSYVARHDLELAGVDLSAVKLISLDLSHVNAGFKREKVKPVVGVLGANVLWRHQAVIDYARGLMLLSA
jgi:predicted aspartyl protease